MRRRRWPIVLAAAFFAWVALRGLDSLIRYEQAAGYIFYDALGSPARHFLYVIPGTVLAACAAVMVWRRTISGLVVAVIAAVASALGTLIQTADIRDNLELAKLAYAANREARGLPFDPESLDAVFSPAGLGFVVMIGIMLPFAAACLALLGWLDSPGGRGTADRPDGTF